MVLGDAVGALIIAILLSIYGDESVTALWILVGIFGFFVSVLYPAGESVCSTRL